MRYMVRKGKVVNVSLFEWYQLAWIDLILGVMGCKDRLWSANWLSIKWLLIVYGDVFGD